MRIRTGLLIILDGFGIHSESRFNATKLARTPILNSVLEKYPHIRLSTGDIHGGQSLHEGGNPEVGHLHLAAGRNVPSVDALVVEAIRDGFFFNSQVIHNIFDKLKKRRKHPRLHAFCLVSAAGKSVSFRCLKALVEMARKQEFGGLLLHLIVADQGSRDNASVWVSKFQRECLEAGPGKIVSIMGGYFGADDYLNWNRTEQAYRAAVAGKALFRFSDPVLYLQEKYQNDIIDDFIPPAVSRGYSGMADADALIFLNLEPIKMRQMVWAISKTEFPHFRRINYPALSELLFLSEFEGMELIPTVFPRSPLSSSLGELVSRQGWNQLRVAQSERFSHVTRFFNGFRRDPFEGEHRVKIDSDENIASYQQRPEMKAREMTERLISELNTGSYRLGVVNFANPDMVSHTGNLCQTAKSIEAVDGCLKSILDWVESQHAFALITSSHGSSEQMLDKKGQLVLEHKGSLVPFILVDAKRNNLTLRSSGSLIDVAPTMLRLWGLEIPEEMTGMPLVDTSH